MAYIFGKSNTTITITTTPKYHYCYFVFESESHSMCVGFLDDRPCEDGVFKTKDECQHIFGAKTERHLTSFAEEMHSILLQKRKYQPIYSDNL